MPASRTSPPDLPPFGLPGVSFARIKEILKGYGGGDPLKAKTVGEVATIVTVDASSVSRNSKFFLGTGLLSGGKERSLTERGRRLFDALSVQDDAASRKCWREVVYETPFLRDRLTTLQLKESMRKDKFVDVILSAPGVKATNSTRAGAHAIVEIMMEAGVIRKESGNEVAAVPESELDHSVARTHEHTTTDESVPRPPAGSGREPIPVDSGPARTTGEAGLVVPTVTINLQLHLPETENDEIYKKLFRALREELLAHKE